MLINIGPVFCSEGYIDFDLVAQRLFLTWNESFDVIQSGTFDVSPGEYSFNSALDSKILPKSCDQQIICLPLQRASGTAASLSRKKFRSLQSGSQRSMTKTLESCFILRSPFNLMRNMTWAFSPSFSSNSSSYIQSIEHKSTTS